MKHFFYILIFLPLLLWSCTREITTGEVKVPDPIPEVEVADDGSINKVNTYWLYFDWREIPDSVIAKEAPRRKFVVLHAWKHPLIAKFKAANPDIKVYVYKNLSAAIDSYEFASTDPQHTDTLTSTGVLYAYADTYHPEWFLLDDNNNRMNFSGWTFLTQMDVGNTAYQDYWATNVIKEAVKHGWDGVFIDDLLFTPSEHHTDKMPMKYKTIESFQAGYKEILGKIQGAAKSVGKTIIGNMASAKGTAGFWNSYMPYIDGGFDEWWMVYGEGVANHVGGDEWKVHLAEPEFNEDQNKIAIVQPHNGTNLSSFYYALASYWLVNNGKTYFMDTEGRDNYGLPILPWRPEYDWNMGKAAGKYYTFGTNFPIYRRDFAKALVLVNPNNALVTIKLAKPYLNERNQQIEQIALSARSGTILRKISN